MASLRSWIKLRRKSYFLLATGGSILRSIVPLREKILTERQKAIIWYLNTVYWVLSQGTYIKTRYAHVKEKLLLEKKSDYRLLSIKKVLTQIKIPLSLRTCAPLSDLPSEISNMASIIKNKFASIFIWQGFLCIWR